MRRSGLHEPLRGVGIVFLVLLVASLQAGEPASSSTAPVSSAPSVFFAFDDHSIPLRDNLQLTLVEARKHPNNPVLRCGPEDSPDHGHAVLYGSVLRIGDKFRMWYLGMPQRKLERGQAPGYWRPMCYAESSDGVQWTKPDLGLVEFNGNRQNNICQIEADDFNLTRVDDFLSVLYDPDDADTSRRYKSAFIAHVPWNEVAGGVRDVGSTEKRLCAMICATSADGLRWRVVGDRPAVNEKFEVSSLYRFGNFYYAAGQQITPWSWLADGSPAGRVMTIFRSPDLLHWSQAKALGFARAGQTTHPPVAGQQTHMGAGLWNRGNVLVGLYGMWQDGPKERPKGSSYLYGMRMDLGLVVSDDGLHFREPVPDFKVIPRGNEGQWDSIALLQGHAFTNVGDRTYLWYSHWDCEGQFRSQEIGLATLRRDGFGYLSRRSSHDSGHFVTALVGASSPGRRLLVNVEGVSVEHPLRVELLDEFDRPIAGYSGADAARIVAPGVGQPIVWPAGGERGPANQAVALKVQFPAAGDVRVYAVYLE
jgi:hypothetical protein